MIGLTVTNLVSTFSASCKQSTFFGLKSWYYYLQRKVVDGDCMITFNVLPSNGSGRSDILLIVLALVDDLLTLAGILAIGYVIYSGVLYLTSQGSPDSTQKAQHALQNALIGLVICVLAIAIVRFLGAKLG